MVKKDLKSIKEELERLTRQRAIIEEELAKKIGQTFMKSHPEIQSIKEFKNWLKQADSAILNSAKREEEAQQNEETIMSVNEQTYSQPSVDQSNSQHIIEDHTGNKHDEQYSFNNNDFDQNHY